MHVSNSSRSRTPIRFLFLASAMVLCAGCKSCVRGGPDIFDPSKLKDSGRGATTVSVPKPSGPASATALDPRPAVPPPTVEELNERAHADGLLVEVYFDFDRADLSSDARTALEQNARYLRQEAAVRVQIEGHCDERGTHEYNLALGQLRAGATREYLIRLGIEPERLGTISYGEHEGVCFVSNERCWGQNRRAYFRITGLDHRPDRASGATN